MADTQTLKLSGQPFSCLTHKSFASMRIEWKSWNLKRVSSDWQKRSEVAKTKNGAARGEEESEKARLCPFGGS